MNSAIPILLFFLAPLVTVISAPATEATHPAIVISEFIYQQAPFPACHASTIVETSSGFVAAWFGGTAEKNPDVGIWYSRFNGKSWSPPIEAANGIQPEGKRLPCWNPVLFQPSNGPLLLFYKVGPSPSTWWGMMMSSTNQGESWSAAQRLPDGFLGPIKNKPVELADGSLLCPSSTENSGWKVHLEEASGNPFHWKKTPALNDPAEFGAIQPSILIHGPAEFQIVCRSNKRAITEAWSHDAGKTWGPMTKTSLPNPNSGIDAVQLRNGSSWIVYNHTTFGRSPLNLAISSDGKNWQPALTLESNSGEYSYPSVIQARDGLVHLTYTWKRQRIKHVVIDPKKISLPAR